MGHSSYTMWWRCIYHTESCGSLVGRWWFPLQTINIKRSSWVWSLQNVNLKIFMGMALGLVLTILFCSITQRNRYAQNNWRIKHNSYLLDWEQREQHDPEDVPAWQPGTPNHRYLRWFHSVTRFRLRPTWVEDDIEDVSLDEDQYDEYTRGGVQPERGPLHDYMV